MRRQRTAKDALDQIRLLMAQYLLEWALKICPSGHEDTLAFFEGALLINRKVVKNIERRRSLERFQTRAE